MSLDLDYTYFKLYKTVLTLVSSGLNKKLRVLDLDYVSRQPSLTIFYVFFNIWIIPDQNNSS